MRVTPARSPRRKMRTGSIAVLAMSRNRTLREQIIEEQRKEMEEIANKNKTPNEVAWGHVHRSLTESGVITSRDASDTPDELQNRARQRRKTIEENDDKLYTHHRALFCLTPSNLFRKRVIKVVEAPWFDRTAMTVIMINCIFLGLTDPLEEDVTRNDVVETSEYFFIVIFTLEMLCKILAMGFVLHPGAYLRDKWNWLDFTVVCLGYVGIASEAGNYTAIRVFRVFRALKTLKSLPAIRVLAQSLLAALRLLGDVMLQCVFLFFIFGIVGIQIFGGSFNGRCGDPITGVVDESDERLCSIGTSVSTSNDDFTFPHQCAVGNICLDTGVNPNFGATNFDNIGWAWLTIFQVITLEGWTDIMYQAQDATGPLAALYFILLVTFGAFLVMNLALAVISDKYGEKSADELDRKRRLGSKADMEVTTLFKIKRWFKNKFDVDEDNAPEFARHCHAVAMSKKFQNFINAMIFLNTLFLALEHHNQPDALTDFLFVANIVLTVFFTIEAVVKMIGFGLYQYFKENMNLLDFWVVIASWIEIAISGGEGGMLSVFRAFRLLRLLKLIRSWESLKDLLTKIGTSAAAIMSFVPVVMLFVFVFALIGMQFFGGNFDFTPATVPATQTQFEFDDIEEWLPRSNFDSLLNSAFSIFQIITGENWNEIWWNGMRATGNNIDEAEGGAIASLYFVLVFVIGNYIILNVFLAILLVDIEVEHRERESKKMFSAVRKAFDDVPWKRKKTRASISTDSVESNGSSRKLSFWKRKSTLRRPSSQNSMSDIDNDGKSDCEPQIAPEPDSLSNSNGPEDEMDRKDTGSETIFEDEAMEFEEGPPYPCCMPFFEWQEGRSLCIFHPENKLRLRLDKVINHPYFESFIIFLIIFSSILLVFETSSLQNDPTLIDLLEIMDVFFVIMFMLEMIMKVIVMGFVCNKTGYLRDGWNILDFLIVVISILDLALSSQGEDSLKQLRALRAFRALRPLRLIKRLEGVRVVVNSLIKAIPSVMNVAFVSLLFWLIFAILGVQLFAGKFAKCDIRTVECGRRVKGGIDPNECFPVIADKAACLGAGGNWVNSDANFDNVIYALLTLFEVSTLENWLFVMIDAMDSTSVNGQPIRENAPWLQLYFVLFIIVCSFFVLNLFVSVIADTFAKIKAHSDGTALLTGEQKEWVKVQKEMIAQRVEKQAERSRHPFRAVAWDIVHHPYFEPVIVALICLNTVMMATQHADQSEGWELTLELCSVVFSVFFMLEAFFKLMAFGKQYWKDRWNVFDFTIVVTSIFSMVVWAAGSTLSVNPSTLRALRVLRLLRMVRLVKRLKGLRVLFQTLYLSLPSIFNVGSLLGLLLFVYAILGAGLFKDVKIDVDDNEYLSPHANFRTFDMALITLIRITTGEAWNGIMWEVMVEEPGAWMYFVTFVIFGTLVMLNLFIAVILEAFQNVTEQEENIVTADDLDMFADVWKKYDTNVNLLIPIKDLPEFLLDLDAPLGLRGLNATNAGVLKVVDALNLPLHDGQINYHQLLHSLMTHAYGKLELPEKLAHEIDSQFKKKKIVVPKSVDVTETAAAHLAAVKLQTAHREYRRKKTEPAIKGDGSGANSSSGSVNRMPSYIRQANRHVLDASASRVSESGSGSQSSLDPISSTNALSVPPQELS